MPAPIFFLPPRRSSLNKLPKSPLIFVQKAVPRRFLWTPSSGYTRLFDYNSWKKSGLCISESCLVGESTFEGGVTVFIAVTNTTFELKKKISLCTVELRRLSFLLFSFHVLFSHQVREDTPNQKHKTKPNTNLRSNSRESKKGADMSGGDVVCSGWLRKSPPEKKLRRYVSAPYVLFLTLLKTKKK